MATEEPKFKIIVQHQQIELREYPAMIVAETYVEGDMDAASGQGFRAIADYIFGNNVAAAARGTKTAEKIAMTVPVTLEAVAPPAQKIEMTVPVTLTPSAANEQGSETQALAGAKRWRLHFVMPSRYTLETLPKPNNPAVIIRTVPAKKWAV
ncbi:MAG: SOUL family heme-binding protein, partial [Deefgea sp.]